MNAQETIACTNFDIVSDIFKQLSDSSRLKIFWLLCHYEENVNNISNILSMTSPAVSHHLRILKTSGLIVSRREGKEVYYSASDSETCMELHHMMEKIMTIHCPVDEKDIKPYQTEQIETIHEIHDKITCDLAKRYTIDELAGAYLMNATTLKTTFKNTYGLPIASYMKKYRMDTAARLLEENKKTIAEIAALVGYESQGKFTKAFKDEMGMSPTEYKKECQK